MPTLLDPSLAAKARAGDLPFFEALDRRALEAASGLKDEDERSLLHAASSSGNLSLVQMIAEAGGKKLVDDMDDEVRGLLCRIITRAK